MLQDVRCFSFMTINIYLLYIIVLLLFTLSLLFHSLAMFSARFLQLLGACLWNLCLKIWFKIVINNIGVHRRPYGTPLYVLKESVPSAFFVHFVDLWCCMWSELLVLNGQKLLSLLAFLFFVLGCVSNTFPNLLYLILF